MTLPIRTRLPFLALHTGDKDQGYTAMAAWVYADPSIAGSVIQAVGDDFYKLLTSSTEAVRERMLQSKVWKAASKAALKPATRSADAEVDPAKVAPYFDAISQAYDAEIRAEFRARTGVDLETVWDMAGATLGHQPLEPFLESLHADWEDQMWSVDTVESDLEMLYSPFFQPAKSADFYSRHRIAIRSLILRTETTTLFGVRNTKEIDLAIQKFIEQKKPGWVMSETMLHLHDKEPDQKLEMVNGYDFEVRCAEIIRESGHQVEVTTASSDKGVDLIVETQDYRIAVQCKLLSKPAGIKAVQEVVAGAKHYKVDFGMVVCDAGFTQAAEDLAASNGVVLANTRAIRRLDVLF